MFPVFIKKHVDGKGKVWVNGSTKCLLDNVLVITEHRVSIIFRFVNVVRTVTVDKEHMWQLL